MTFIEHLTVHFVTCALKDYPQRWVISIWIFFSVFHVKLRRKQRPAHVFDQLGIQNVVLQANILPSFYQMSSFLWNTIPKFKYGCNLLNSSFLKHAWIASDILNPFNAVNGMMCISQDYTYSSIKNKTVLFKFKFLSL